MPSEGLETHELREQLEEANEHAHGHAEHGGGPRWTLYLSLSTAIVAVFAAIASLKSGEGESYALIEKNQAILVQAQATNQWSYYQAKSTKQAVYEVQSVVAGEGSPLATKLHDEIARYEQEKEKIKVAAEKLEEEIKKHEEIGEGWFHRHHRFALSVTVFQVSIALSAIAALTKRQLLWWVSMAVGLVGALYFVKGFGLLGG
jgi:hypothetical protein